MDIRVVSSSIWRKIFGLRLEVPRTCRDLQGWNEFNFTEFSFGKTWRRALTTILLWWDEMSCVVGTGVNQFHVIWRNVFGVRRFWRNFSLKTWQSRSAWTIRAQSRFDEIFQNLANVVTTPGVGWRIFFGYVVATLGLLWLYGYHPARRFDEFFFFFSAAVAVWWIFWPPTSQSIVSLARVRARLGPPNNVFRRLTGRFFLT